MLCSEKMMMRFRVLELDLPASKMVFHNFQNDTENDVLESEMITYLALNLFPVHEILSTITIIISTITPGLILSKAVYYNQQF